MSDPDPATIAFDRELGIERMYPDEWFQRRVSDAHDALDMARPLIAAAALADAHLVPDTLVAEAIRDERQRIRQVIDKHEAECMCDGYALCSRLLADLLDGDVDE